MAEGSEFELWVRFLYLILFSWLRFSSSASGRQRRTDVLSAANLSAVIKECRFPCVRPIL